MAASKIIKHAIELRPCRFHPISDQFLKNQKKTHTHLLHPIHIQLRLLDMCGYKMLQLVARLYFFNGSQAYQQLDNYDVKKVIFLKDNHVMLASLASKSIFLAFSKMKHVFSQ